MEEIIKGDVVILPFPFSDLSNSKKRPALVVAGPHGKDITLAQITSRIDFRKYSVDVLKDAFEFGSLPIESFVRVNRLFSADSSIIDYKAGHLKEEKIKLIESKLVELFTE